MLCKQELKTDLSHHYCQLQMTVCKMYSALMLIGDTFQARIGIWKCWFLRWIGHFTIVCLVINQGYFALLLVLHCPLTVTLPSFGKLHCPLGVHCPLSCYIAPLTHLHNLFIMVFLFRSVRLWANDVIFWRISCLLVLFMMHWSKSLAGNDKSGIFYLYFFSCLLSFFNFYRWHVAMGTSFFRWCDIWYLAFIV